MSYGVVVAWVGSPPDLSLINKPGNGFESYDQGFTLLLESVYTSLFQSEGGGKEDDEKIGDLSWFVVSGSTSVDNSGKVCLHIYNFELHVSHASGDHPGQYTQPCQRHPIFGQG